MALRLLIMKDEYKTPFLPRIFVNTTLSAGYFQKSYDHRQTLQPKCRIRGIPLLLMPLPAVSNTTVTYPTISYVTGIINR